MNNISIDGVYQPSLKAVSQTDKKESASFTQVMKTAMGNIDGMGKNADNAIVDMLQGKADVPATMIELQKFDISMQLFLSMRNKAIEAYKEVSRMQF
ncbi:flagellar hook-basal body complex protein FliE [Desulfocicer niacini]